MDIFLVSGLAELILKPDLCADNISEGVLFCDTCSNAWGPDWACRDKSKGQCDMAIIKTNYCNSVENHYNNDIVCCRAATSNS